ncbi:MAG: hypothetical protein JWM73_452 [Solirubrobacterales bacterium]|nr:hypothetical protein [Solirubrobacterales bacterium]
MARLLLLPAFAGPAAVLPLLFLRWFEPRGNFLVLFGRREGLIFHATAWEASGGYAALLALLAVATIGCAAAAARGRFVLWTGAAGAAVVGALVCLILRHSPPDPGPGVFVPGSLALQPTPAALVAMACFLMAALGATAWALVVMHRRG